MWVLQLNPMQGRYEDLNPVAWAETKTALEAYVAREKVQPYSDDAGHNMCGGALTKSFRKGSPLEYLNPPDRPECFVEVLLEDWLAQTTQRYERLRGGLLMV